MAGGVEEAAGAGMGLAPGRLVEELRREPEVAVNWLMVYMTYFRNFVFSVARYLYQSVGLRAAVMQLGNMVEEAIQSSFHVQRRAAAARGLRLETLDDLFRLNRYCHEEAAARLAPLGIEVFRVGRRGDSYYMEASDCSLMRAAEELPVVKVFPVALVSGLIKGLGYRSRWLSSPRELGHLCRSVREGHTARPDYVVYLDETVEPPACRIIVEPLRCPP
ncbi:MAG: hypothetical protein GXO15_01560 [Crenarchaeota archaeon]|nr:hypothetical protein [Thermoproteota archaeon]